MLKTKKVVSMLVALGMFASVGLTACGSNNATESTTSQSAVASTAVQTSAESTPAAKDVTLKFGYWGSSGEDKAYAKAIEGIEAAVPGVKVELQQYPSDKDFWDNLPAQIAAKTAPDILNVTNEGYMEYINNGLFLPIDDVVKSANIDLSGLTKSAVDIWTVDGKLYGIPNSAAPAAFIVNMDMWKAAGLKDLPKTMDEMKAAAKALTKNGVKGLCLDANAYHLTQYILAFGGSWGEGKTINTPENAAALQFCIDMYKEGLAVTAKQAGLGWDGEVVGKGKAAMSTGGTWYTGFLKDAAPNMNYEIIPVPKGTVNGCTMHSYGYVVLKDAKDKDAAVEAAAYMARDDFQQANAEILGTMPSSTKVAATYFEKNPKLKNLQPALEYAKPFGYPAEKKFMDELVKQFEEAVYKSDSKLTGQKIVENLAEIMK
ncbi:ABC transporter substrate-binding protein [Ruminiclostridium cellobioparum]|jgi:multiple sugar transport system substrate-binding protein|uniref:ABC transporter substrate-binding protein n=1 Tax=Ruminiclostridium cellobioparum TaxID=29355 RepID=UPI0028B1040E|nr:sugar ABC transporter substrate-binding protein [Ruminiclostridium cellobioparum]